MQLKEKEKKIITQILVFFVIAVVLTNIAQKYSVEYSYEQNKTKRDLQDRESSLNANLAGIEDAQLKFRLNNKQFKELQKKGFVDRSQRQDPVNWIKVMQKIKTERRLNVVNFNFGEGFTLQPGSSIYTDGSTAGINILDMEISMPMLHDLDIFMFSKELEERTDSILFPVECTIIRSEEVFDLKISDNFSGLCNFIWVAINDPESKVKGEEEVTEQKVSDAQ